MGFPGAPSRWVWLALAAVAAAAGCFSDRGLAIEVDVGDTGAASVELYVATAKCAPGNKAGIDCTTITPPNDLAPLAGDVWFRDADPRYVAEVHGHTAMFQLKADVETTLPIVVAVGSLESLAVGTATLRTLVIPTDRARVVKLALVAAKPVATDQVDTKTLNEDRVQVWNKQMPASACVVVEHWRTGVAVARDFVVPAEDPDCDDVANECNPAAYLGSAPAGTSGPACFVPATAGTCVLGSRGCRDDGGQPGICAAPPQDTTCVPSQFCGCMGPGAGSGPDANCLQQKIDPSNNGPSNVPRLECQVPARIGLGNVDLCPDHSTADIDLDRFYGGSRCEQPRIGSLRLGDFGSSHTFGGAEMAVSSADDPCKLTVTWKSGTRTSDLPVDHGMLSLDSRNGTVLLPIVFHFQGSTCATDDFTCEFAGDANDTLWTCAQ
jgi:hypothetical protein